MLARNRHQVLALIGGHHPTQRVMQGRHAVDGPHRTASAEFFQGYEIRPGVGDRDRHHFQMQRFGQHLEPWVGQGIGGNHIAGLQQRHHRHRQSVLGTADDQHLFSRHVQAATAQMPRRRSPFMQAPGVRLVAQMGFQITGQRQLAQGRTQQIGLARQRRIIEVQVHHPRDNARLMHAQTRRQRRLPDKRTATGFPADQPHAFQIGINPTGRDQRQTFRRRELPVRRQACAGRQLS